MRWAALTLLMLAGCSQLPEYRWVERPDFTMQREVFLECLKAVPQGPANLTASGNDWAEVVEACDTGARHVAQVRSFECVSFCGKLSGGAE